MNDGLCLTRNPGESIIIRCGDTVITVYVSDIRGSSARLKIQAPEAVAINREEIDRKKFPSLQPVGAAAL